MKKIAAALLFVLLLPALAAAAPATMTAAQLTDLLEKNRGKVVMLNFFATWCPPCRIELPELRKLRDAYPEKELVIIGLSVDEDAAPVPEFTREAGVNYPIYMAGKSVTDKFNVSSVPHNAFFAPSGEMMISEPGVADMSVMEDLVNRLLKIK